MCHQGAYGGADVVKWDVSSLPARSGSACCAAFGRARAGRPSGRRSTAGRSQPRPAAASAHRSARSSADVVFGTPDGRDVGELLDQLAPNPRIKRERVSRSRCAELRKHAQHKSLGAHRLHLCYTVTRHKTCHVSVSYISAAIRARSTSSRGSHRSGLRPLPRSPGHLDRLDDPAGGGATQRGPVRVGELGHREAVADLPEYRRHPDRPVPAARADQAIGGRRTAEPSSWCSSRWSWC